MAVSLGVALLALTGCASPPERTLPAGSSIDEVRRQWGEPVATFASADGGQRLEFSSGAFGKSAHMVDFDARGRLVRWIDVRNEARFATIRPGMTREQLRRELGSPSRVWAVRYHDQTIWSYRYEGPFCQLFSVGILPNGLVEDTGYGIDPACERDQNVLSRGRQIGW